MKHENAVLWLVAVVLTSSALGANVVRERTVACSALEAHSLIKSRLAVTTNRPDLIVRGCIVLKSGLSVIGPLSTRSTAEGRFALIEVSGEGKRWTFLDALRDQHVLSLAPQNSQTGRFANKLITDTLGCSSVDLMSKAVDAAAHKHRMPPGCIDLNEDGRGLPVIGPLEIVKPASSSTCRDLYAVCWALVEVPGKGKLWTFLGHLKDRHGN
jgi:hypothetical protein